ncbi:hypothetical protein NKG05_17895 [Oerskovia sp. M15]
MLLPLLTFAVRGVASWSVGRDAARPRAPSSWGSSPVTRSGTCGARCSTGTRSSRSRTCSAPRCPRTWCRRTRSRTWTWRGARGWECASRSSTSTTASRPAPSRRS